METYSPLRRPTPIVLVVLCLAVIVGCTKSGRPEPERVRVTGMVTLDGAPLPEGRIEFKSVSTGVIDGLVIKDGMFDGRAAIGERRVEFSVVQQVPYKGPAMPGVEPPHSVAEETLPKHLNTTSDYAATVTLAGPNEFHFDLFRKPKN